MKLEKIRKKRNLKEIRNTKEIEKRLKNAMHDGMFYYNCGIAVANIMNEDNIDGFNAALGGMFYFESLIGLNKSN